MTLIARTAATLALGTLIGAASAATVHVRFDNPIFSGVPAPAYDNVTITFPAPVGGGSSTVSTAAGRFQGTGSNVVGVDPAIFVDGLDDLFMYCYDVYEHVGSGWQADYTINFDGESLRTLDFLGAVNAVLNQRRSTNDPYAWLHPLNGFEAAAVQLGIWESKYDSSGWSLGSGSFRAGNVDAGTALELNAYFGAIPSTAALDGRFVMTLEAHGVQDMITGDPPARVPEPGTLALAAVAGAALWRRRRTHG